RPRSGDRPPRSAAHLPPVRAGRRSPESRDGRQRHRTLARQPRRSGARRPGRAPERSRTGCAFYRLPSGRMKVAGHAMTEPSNSDKPCTADGRQETVLVVEDDPTLRLALTKALRSAGFRVRVAASGPEGLEAALTEPPDLLLLDVMLPGM